MKPFYLLKILFLIVLSMLCNSAVALYINADISSMESGQEFFSKPYINDTNKTNLYNFSAYKIDKPGNQEHGTSLHNGEIIFTPLNYGYHIFL